MSDFPDRELFTRDFVKYDLNSIIKPANQKNSIPFKHENKQVGKVTDITQDVDGIHVSGYIYDEQIANIIRGTDPLAGYSIGSIGEKPRRTSMEEKIVKWLKEHRRDLVIVTVTALVTAKLAKGGRVVTVEKDGYIFSIPKELFKQL